MEAPRSPCSIGSDCGHGRGKGTSSFGEKRASGAITNSRRLQKSKAKRRGSRSQSRRSSKHPREAHFAHRTEGTRRQQGSGRVRRSGLPTESHHREG